MSDAFDELAREFTQRSRNADPYIIVRPARKRSIEGQHAHVQDIVDECIATLDGLSREFSKEPEAHTQE